MNHPSQACTVRPHSRDIQRTPITLSEVLLLARIAIWNSDLTSNCTYTLGISHKDLGQSS